MSPEPMNIGLIGAPGAGKLDLAEELAERWPAGTELGDKPWIVDRLTAASRGENGDSETINGLPLGPTATWRTSMVLYSELLAQREMVCRDVPTIEVGTCFDHMAHVGQKLKALSARMLEPDFLGSEREEILHIQQALPGLAIALVETWNYDYAFYLPLPEGADDFAKRVDEALQEVMESYIEAGTSLSILRLDGGTLSDRADTVLKVLHEFEPKRLEAVRELEEAEAELRAKVAGETSGPDGADAEAAASPE